MANTDAKMALKLLIDKSSNKVLFGEASKDVVDFIFNILSLPLGAVSKLLSKNHSYILSDGEVSSLLNSPLASTTSPRTSFLLPPTTHQRQDTKDMRVYICPNTNKRNDPFGVRPVGTCLYVSEVQRVNCPSCGNIMTVQAQLVDTKAGSSVAQVGSEDKGYVIGVVTYSVMDDLTVLPMSTISSIVFLNKFHIKDLGSLEERIVNIGFEEGLKLLKASLRSKTVLTDVFLQKNR